MSPARTAPATALAPAAATAKLVGRDAEILRLERALRAPGPAVVVHGLAGIGKTMLARELVAWLHATGGLADGWIWQDLADLRQPAEIWRPAAERLGLAPGAPDDALVEGLRRRRLLIVWDNFGRLAGSPAEGRAASFGEPARRDLVDRLRALRGGGSRILILSRGPAEWLAETRVSVPLGGLPGAERWQFFAAVLGGPDALAAADQAVLRNLYATCAGHPAASRLMTMAVGSFTEAQAARSSDDPSPPAVKPLPADDVDAGRLGALLVRVEDALPSAWRPLVAGIALHGPVLDADLLSAMALSAAPRQVAAIDDLCAALESAGLLRTRGRRLYDRHPLAFSSAAGDAGEPGAGVQRDAWCRAFVEVMARYAESIAALPTAEARSTASHLHGVSFLTAAGEAERLGLPDFASVLLARLGADALHLKLYDEAATLLDHLAAIQSRFGTRSNQAAALHLSGMLAQERRRLAAAEDLFLQSLAREHRRDGARGRAASCHQLGVLAAERRDFAAAAVWLRKALRIWRRLGDRQGIAATSLQMGILAQDRHRYGAARAWYRKAIAHWQALEATRELAAGHHQMGVLAFLQGDLAGARRAFFKARAIKRRLGAEHATASDLHMLGLVAEAEGHLPEAARWLTAALRLAELAPSPAAADSCIHLGEVERRRGRLTDAALWFEKALSLYEQLDSLDGQAAACHRLGMAADDRGDLDGAWEFHQRARTLSRAAADPEPEALACYGLGRVAAQRGRLEEAVAWLTTAQELFGVLDRRARRKGLRLVRRGLARLRRELASEPGTEAETESGTGTGSGTGP